MSGTTLRLDGARPVHSKNDETHLESTTPNLTILKAHEVGIQKENYMHTTLESDKSMSFFSWKRVAGKFKKLLGRSNLSTIFTNKLDQFGSRASDSPLYSELKESNPEHPFITLMIYAQLDSAHYSDQNVQTVIYTSLDKAKVTAQDVEEALIWVGEIRLECWLDPEWCIGDSNLVRHAEGLRKALIYKKEFEAKYPDQKITFDPIANASLAYYGSKRSLFLIDGENLRSYEKEKGL